ncbi:MAG: hypothetical protein KF805_13775, partial [Phycisphaeraceae bacterium]|nr:hypothetical protein [Phycisphaeraceae bacterium]
MLGSLQSVRTLVGTFVLTLALGAASVKAGVDPVFAKLTEAKSPAIVTIKFVLKISMGGSDEERETEIAGVMVDPEGMVMASNLQLGGVSEAMRSFMSQGMSMSPKDIKVLIGEDTEGVEAKLVARDSELDLAWVQINTKPEKPYAAIDFSAGSKATQGQTLYSLERLGKFFDRAPTVNSFEVGAIVAKPRKLFVPSQRIGSGLGTPIFSGDMTVVGVTVLQLPSKEELEAEQGMMGASRGVGEVILPCEDVANAIKKAKEAAASGKP